MRDRSWLLFDRRTVADAYLYVVLLAGSDANAAQGIFRGIDEVERR